MSSTTLSRGNIPLEIRNGVALFDGGAELSLRQVELRSQTAIETTDEAGKKTRTVEVVWTTGAPVMRYSWCDDEYYEESLEVSEAAIDFERMRNGASVLNSHWGYDLESVLGTVEDVRIEDGKGIARIRMSNRASIDEIWQDIQDGIIRHISVGYRVTKWEVTREEGKLTTKRAVAWEPHEISFVAIPADSGSGTRNKDNTLNQRRTESNVSQATNTNVPAAAGTETTAERSEQETVVPAATAAEIRACPDAAEIVRYVADNNLDADIAVAAIRSGNSLGEVVRANVNAAAESARETEVSTNRTSATVTSQRSPEREMDLRAEMRTVEALELYGIRSDLTPSDEAREFAGEGLRGGAIAFLRNIGVSVNERMSDAAIIGEALNRSAGGGFTTSDYLNIITKPAEAALDQGWKDSIPETTYAQWTGEMRVKDFNAREAFSASLFSGIGPVTEDGELPLAEMDGNSYSLKLGTDGIEIALTRHAIINDDLGIWMSSMNDLGVSWGLYNEASAINVLENGKVKSSTGTRKLFSEAAGNQIAITDLDEDNLEKLVLELRGQRQDAKLGGGLIQTAPRFLMVSPDYERKANKLVAEAPGAASPNPYAGKMQVVVNDSFKPKTVYLTGASAMKQMIKRVQLQGQNGPQLERLANVSSQRVVYHSFEDARFQAASHLGAVKGILPG